LKTVVPRELENPSTALIEFPLYKGNPGLVLPDKRKECAWKLMWALAFTVVNYHVSRIFFGSAGNQLYPFGKPSPFCRSQMTNLSILDSEELLYGLPHGLGS
jgi:hypothetical protein